MIALEKFLIEKLLLFLLIWATVLVQSPGKDIFVLGDEEGMGALIFPVQVQEGPDGNIYAYDQKDALIKIYSPEGKFIRAIGGSAEGPGFIKRTDGVNIGFTPDNHLFFTEYFGGHPWITILGLDGTFHNTIPLKVNANYFGVESAVSLPDGGFLIEFAFIGESKKTNKYFMQSSPQELCRVDSKGQITSTIKKISYFTEMSKLEMGASLTIPFTPVFKWLPLGNDTIVFTDGVDQYLTVLDFKGELIKKVKIPIPPQAQEVTGKDLDKWREERKNNFLKTQRGIEWYRKYGSVIEDYKDSIYTKKPILEDILVTPGGNILITGVKDEKNPGRNFRLIDEKGKVQTEIKSDIISINISRNFIFFVKTEKDDDEEVVYCFKRNGAEHKDLLNLIARLLSIKSLNTKE